MGGKNEKLKMFEGGQDLSPISKETAKITAVNPRADVCIQISRTLHVN